MNHLNQHSQQANKIHYKMFKSKHGWLVSGLALAIFTSLPLTGTAMADANPTTTTGTDTVAASDASLLNTKTATLKADQR